MTSSCLHAIRTCKSSNNCTTTTLQQTLTTAQHTNKRAQQLRANQQVGHVEIQGTFHQALDPKFKTFRLMIMFASF